MFYQTCTHVIHFIGNYRETKDLKFMNSAVQLTWSEYLNTVLLTKTKFSAKFHIENCVNVLENYILYMYNDQPLLLRWATCKMHFMSCYRGRDRKYVGLVHGMASVWPRDVCPCATVRYQQRTLRQTARGGCHERLVTYVCTSVLLHVQQGRLHHEHCKLWVPSSLSAILRAVKRRNLPDGNNSFRRNMFIPSSGMKCVKAKPQAESSPFSGLLRVIWF
jgi:hypothetical protein